MKTLILTGIIILLGLYSLRNLVNHFRGKGDGCASCSHDKEKSCGCGCESHEEEQELNKK